MQTFHLAIPTHDLALAKAFYTAAFGASIGREYAHYTVFNFFGHQLVTHLAPEEIPTAVRMYPRHYGIIFSQKAEFDQIYQQCKISHAPFFKDLFERYRYEQGWHWSFFVSDPSDNLIELKFYMQERDIFH